MNVLFSILILIASLLLILVVLMQKSKGGGLSSSFSSSNAILGYKKTTDFIEKITWILATIVMVLCVALVTVNNNLGRQNQMPTLPKEVTAPIVNDFLNNENQTVSPIEQETAE